MKKAALPTDAVQEDDADIRAVRRLMTHDEDHETATGAVEKIMPDKKLLVGSSRQPPDIATSQARNQASRTRTPRCESRLAEVGAKGLSRLKAYRPDRKSIAWTSLVLLLLLRPLLVIGSALAVMGLVILCYIVVGGDVFWRRVIRLFETLERRAPVLARQIKLRAYAFGKKWDRALARLPDPISDGLRGPDLRRVIAAEAHHDAVLTDRLKRLR
ncbi:hypothetical protein [Roseobacter weihaiensis]|uniref:hypothetical protein n=1 Tax=Roseobacter weihaiensis TaxID=2763262 RepID=UPI001D09B258|nr:hypothetical protein [Roseobacter sp. H9]